MLQYPTLRAALLLVLSYLPFLASSRSIPPSSRDLSSRAVGANIHAYTMSDNHYARTVQLSDGSLLMGYAHSDGTAQSIEVLRSTDGGLNFEQYGQIAQRDSNVDMDNTFLVEIGSTSPPTVLAAFRNHDKDDTGVYTWYRITVCRSEDGGKTWKFASQAVEFSAESSGGLGVWEPFMRIGNDGKVQLTYSGELSADNQETFRTISNDGFSWSKPVNLKIHEESKELRDGMQGIVKVKDQKSGREALVMVFETTSRGQHLFNIEYAVSYDDGASYGDRGVVYVPADGKQAGSPQIVNTDDNVLAVLFMTDESTSTQDWPNIAQVKSLTSQGLRDGKINWSTSPKLVGDGNSHWPGLSKVAGRVFGTYDQNGVIQGVFLDDLKQN